MSQPAIPLTTLRAAGNTNVEERRDRFLTHLGQTLTCLGEVRADLVHLRSDHPGDVDFAEGCAGADIAAFLDDAARSVRASYAVAVAVIESQLPAERPTSPIPVVDRP
jgi:hypothetical protein